MSAVEGTLLPRADHQIAEYDEFRSQLAEIRKNNAALVFDYASPKGNKEARSYVYKLRQTKAAIERARKKAKEDLIERGRRIDGEAKELIAQVEEMIEVHQKPLDEIEQREKDRIAGHEKRLAEIIYAGQSAQESWLEIDVEHLRISLAKLESLPITEAEWEEFTVRAAEAKDQSLIKLRAAINLREKHDAEQAELERLRREAAEREQRERDEQIRREAEARAKREAEEAAERQRQAAEARARAEREAAERRELELRLAAEKAEREKVEAEQRAARAAKDAEERLRREQRDKELREAAERARREADRAHRASVNGAALKALVAGGITEDVAKTVIKLVAKGEVPHMVIQY